MNFDILISTYDAAVIGINRTDTMSGTDQYFPKVAMLQRLYTQLFRPLQTVTVSNTKGFPAMLLIGIHHLNQFAQSLLDRQSLSAFADFSLWGGTHE